MKWWVICNFSSIMSCMFVLKYFWKNNVSLIFFYFSLVLLQESISQESTSHNRNERSGDDLLAKALKKRSIRVALGVLALGSHKESTFQSLLKIWRWKPWEAWWRASPNHYPPCNARLLSCRRLGRVSHMKMRRFLWKIAAQNQLRCFLRSWSELD